MKPNGFTQIELLVVIFIVAVLAAVTVPLIQGRFNEAKWAEGNAAAGMLQRVVKMHHARGKTPMPGKMDEPDLLNALEMQKGDLDGSYFTAQDYDIVSISDEGVAVIRVTGSQENAPNGSRTLAADGSWK